MIQKPLFGAGLVLVALAAPAGPAAAADARNAGCARPFHAASVDQVVAMAPDGEADFRKTDRNSDDLLCIKVDDRGFVFTDDRVPSHSAGGGNIPGPPV